MNQSHADLGQERILLRHAEASEYAAFLQTFAAHRGYARPSKETARLLLCRTRFVQRYPNLTDWFSAPLTERVGRLYREDYNHSSSPVSYRARYYLIFLALCGYASMDWEWLIATHKLGLEPFLPILGYQPVLPPLVETAVNLGYERTDAQMTLQWGCPGCSCILVRPTSKLFMQPILPNLSGQWLALANDPMSPPFSARVSATSKGFGRNI